jgi:nucleoid DNA-binding protein
VLAAFRKGNATAKNSANMIKSELVQKRSIRDGLARGDRVELRGFGTFSLRKHAARIGCNPRTKDPVSVSEKLVPAFKAAKEMHQRLNPTSHQQQNRIAPRVPNAADSVRFVDA